MKAFSLFSIFIFSTICAWSQRQSGSWRSGPGVIYGDDDRVELFQVQDATIQAVADSTVGLFTTNQFSNGGNFQTRAGVISTLNLNAPIYGRQYGLCTDEPYFNQPSGAFCSGFLVGPDLVATAGHCIEDSKCGETAFAFGFHMQNESTPTLKFPASEVYRCKKVVARELTSRQDYALVQLDRQVPNHRPLNLARRTPQANEPLYVIGHPAGLPKKIAGGSNVRRLENGYFTANTDTYGGNSGSAVFSGQTHEVLGILVRGENDFVNSNQNGKSCRRSFHCANDACRGEDITYIEFIARAMGQSARRFH